MYWQNVTELCDLYSMTQWKIANLTKKNNFSYINGLTKANCKSFYAHH